MLPVARRHRPAALRSVSTEVRTAPAAYFSSLLRGVGPNTVVQGKDRCFCGTAANQSFAPFVGQGERRRPINSTLQRHRLSHTRRVQQ